MTQACPTIARAMPADFLSQGFFNILPRVFFSYAYQALHPVGAWLIDAGFGRAELSISHGVWNPPLGKWYFAGSTIWSSRGEAFKGDGKVIYS